MTARRPAKPRILTPVRIDVHLHHHGLDGLKEQLMAVSAQIAAFAAKVDAATTEIANDLKALRDKLAAASVLTPEDTAVLDGIVSTLDALGKDPETV